MPNPTLATPATPATPGTVHLPPYVNQWVLEREKVEALRWLSENRPPPPGESRGSGEVERAYRAIAREDPTTRSVVVVLEREFARHPQGYEKHNLETAGDAAEFLQKKMAH